MAFVYGIVNVVPDGVAGQTACLTANDNRKIVVEGINGKAPLFNYRRYHAETRELICGDIWNGEECIDCKKGYKNFERLHGETSSKKNTHRQLENTSNQDHFKNTKNVRIVQTTKKTTINPKVIMSFLLISSLSFKFILMKDPVIN